MKELARHVADRASAAGTHRDLARVFFRRGDEVVDRLIRRFGVHREHYGRSRYQRDGLEILDRVVLNRRVDVGIDHVRRVRQDQRVAVSGRPGDQFGADYPGCARAVFDEHGLAELLAQTRRQQAGDEIVATAGRVRHDDADGPAGKIVGGVTQCNGTCTEQDQKRQLFENAHVSFLVKTRVDENYIE